MDSGKDCRTTKSSGPHLFASSTHEAKDQRLFDRIAESYCYKDLVQSSSLARKQRLKQTLSCVPLKQNSTVLEIGCGAGFSARYLRGYYQEYVGIDYSKNLIEYARTHNFYPGVTFEAVNVKDFHERARFDVIFMIGVLHHIDDMIVLRHMVDLLVPGGWLIANEPQSGNPIVRFARLVRKKVDAKYSSDQRELSAAELLSLFLQVGLTDLKLVPQGLFSTPFAEVVMRPQFIVGPISRYACLIDSGLERMIGSCLRFVSWNLIMAGRKPMSA